MMKPRLSPEPSGNSDKLKGPVDFGRGEDERVLATFFRNHKLGSSKRTRRSIPVSVLAPSSFRGVIPICILTGKEQAVLRYISRTEGKRGCMNDER